MKHTYASQNLRRLIEKSIDRLAPHFGLSPAEAERCKEFEIRRELVGKIYRSHSKQVPAYSLLDNFFFFPKRQYMRKDFQICYPEMDSETFEDILGLTGEGLINHETGHRLHAFVNPHITQGIIQFIQTGKRPEHHADLTETVAEYGNMIVGKRDYKNGPFSYCYTDGWRIYSKFGPEFLKVLARMPLQEAINKSLFKIGSLK